MTKKAMAPAIRARPAMPPTTPPTIAPVLLPPPSATGGTGVPVLVSIGEESSVLVDVSEVEVEVVDVDVVEVVLKKGSLSIVTILCATPHMNIDLAVEPGQRYVTHAGRLLDLLASVSGIEILLLAQINASTHQQPVLLPASSHADA
jgi:hypothetical protein